MSAPDNSPGAMPEGHECPEDHVWDEGSGQCVPSPEAGGTIEASGLVGKVRSVVEDYLGQMELRLTKMIDQKIARIVKEQEDLVEDTLRKSLGVDPNPVLTLKDFERLTRKLQVNNTAGGKRSPPTPEPAGPAGNKVKTGTANDVDSLFKEYGF